MLNFGKLYTLNKKNPIVKSLNENGDIRIFKDKLDPETAEYYQPYRDSTPINSVRINNFFNPFILLEQNENHPANVKILFPATNLVGWINSWIVEYFIEFIDE